MNDQGSLGSPSTSNSSNSNSSMSGMPIMNHNNSNNMNNMHMMSNNHMGGGRRDGMIPMSHHNSGPPMPPSYGGYNPRGINTAGVELQLSNIDREIRGLQQQQEQLDQMGGGGGGGGGMRSLTPDGYMNHHSPRNLFTPTQLHMFKDQVRKYRMSLMWNQAATTTPPPSTPSPTITPPMIVPPPLEPRLPARGRGSRGPRGSRGTPRTRTNRPRAPKPSATAPAPPPQLPPPYVRYPTPYARYPRMGVGRPTQYRVPPLPYMQNDMLEGVNDNLNNLNNANMNNMNANANQMQNQNQNHIPEQNHGSDGLVRPVGASNCSFCGSFVADGAGVSLQSCGHTFCRPCVVSSIEHCNSPQIPCPIQHDAQCRGYLLDSEIKALVPDDVLQAFLSRSLTHAMKSDNTLNSCYAQDCPGVCAIEDGLKTFYCPSCNKLNCLTCETTHETPCEASKNKRPGGPDESYTFDIAMKRSRVETAGEAELRKDFETNWEQMCAKFHSESENNCNNTNSTDPTAGSE